ncbi:hypothetical protein MXMO3_03556 (plasmid) [Maritalea myrionectae]|uniref:Uncharacterized protein n=1 Tax=Maritalea myrionectae TaxID=454601 RepID=A0A2R4MJA2_9HYPH|nr:ABC transporter substrate-binding protein [Maritalea myrionectae]AVX06059.1 hypothetical protein MXMO3_03556 [Maritalea myrionectae]
MKNWLIGILSLVLLAVSTIARANDDHVLNIYSATDTAAFERVIDVFEQLNPSIAVRYHEYNTRELYERLLVNQDGADVVISSAMDLQVDLVNRGLAVRFIPNEGKDLPAWSQWLGSLYGFTFEPVAMVYNRKAFNTLELPETRSKLATIIRDHPFQFRHRIGTYDIEKSGVGYLFATQDVQRGYLFSRLVETFGRAKSRLYCCTSEMIEKIGEGELLIGYNILGSYAHGAAVKDDRIGIKLFSDYSLVMTRTAFVLENAKNKVAAKRFVAFLLSNEGQKVIANNSTLIPLREEARTVQIQALLSSSRALLPIRLGPNLLTYLDDIKRRRFINEWRATLNASDD